MVRQVKKGDLVLYVCQKCNFAYRDKRTALDCEIYCKAHNACSLEITKHAVPLE